MMDTISLKKVNKSIKGKRVLCDINVQLKRGEICAFLGRNASGKTMLLRMIAGLILPDEGSVDVFGQPISAQQIFPRDLGLIIETIGLWDHLNGLENLMLLAGIRRKVGREEAKYAMTRVGLDPEDPQKYKAYSLGMKQKLVFAQAIMEEPELLVLDEPTNSMDEEAVDIFRKVIREENARGATILIATHQLEDIKGLPHAYYEMIAGRCTQLRVDQWK